MPDDQDQRFKFVNDDDLNENGKKSITNPVNMIPQQPSNHNIMGIKGGLGWRQLQNNSSENKINNNEEYSEQEKAKDKRIRRLNNINKHLLQILKIQNDELTKRLQKQKFRVPKKQNPRAQVKGQDKQVQGVKKQLQNAYRQIEYYKQTISTLKAKEMPTSEKEKLNQMTSKLKQKNEEIESIQSQIKTMKIIRQVQSKQLSKINNEELADVLKKLDQQIKESKSALREAKKTLTKRQQLQKKQHAYFIEVQALIKKKRLELVQNEEQWSQNDKKAQMPEEQISQLQWKELKEKLTKQKKKYQEYGKKLTYHNYMKSKQSKLLEEVQLKFKEKNKTLEKLKSKLNEVNKLAKIVPKPQISQRVDLKMSKLKDIISRQNTIQLQSISKARVQSQDVRHFKKWELQHAQRENDREESQLKYYPKNQSDQDSSRLNTNQYILHRTNGEAKT